MIYPKCCYRSGNMCLRTFDTFPVDVGFLSNPDIGELVSITAETLAELAKENKEVLWVKFGAHGSGAVEVINKVNTFHKRKTNEAWGTFFLRVAKERKYIK